MSNIFIIDDDYDLCRSLEIQLVKNGHEVGHAQTAAVGLAELDQQSPELILLDLNLPDRSGLEVLGELQNRGCRAPIVMITGRQDTHATIEAMRGGAFDYLRKPFELDDILLILEKSSHLTAKKKRSSLSVEPLADGPREIIGADRKIIEVVKQIGLLSGNRVSVLIEGESGTGKELVARALHEAATPEEPFVAVNCSAIVATLPESEFFGYEKGAFTGAETRKIGKLEYAGTGTVFLDEISDMPLDMQAKILRVLQEREFQRVGGLESIPFSARVVAASNRDLQKAIEKKTFRADLYYRLAVSRITVPPLRDRRGDIPILIQHLLNRITRTLHRPITAIEEDAVRRLQGYDWPGNVRELENILTRAAVLARGEVITEDQLVFSLVGPGEQTAEIVPLWRAEKSHLEQALIATGWNITRTAKLLEISPTTLRKKITDFQLKKLH